MERRDGKVRASLLQRIIAKELVWAIAFYCTATAITLWVAIQAYPDWRQMALRVLIGAAGSAALCWAFFSVIWRICAKLNGAPFHEGDMVRILTGPHRDRVCRIYALWSERGQVRVDLGESAAKDVTDVFSYVEICRLRSE